VGECPDAAYDRDEPPAINTHIRHGRYPRPFYGDGTAGIHRRVVADRAVCIENASRAGSRSLPREPI
jgi:hypothetical protein